MIILEYPFFCERARVRRGGSRAQAPRGRGGGTRAHANPPPHTHTAAVSPDTLSPDSREAPTRTDRWNCNPQKSHHVQSSAEAPSPTPWQGSSAVPNPMPSNGSQDPSAKPDRMAGGLHRTSGPTEPQPTCESRNPSAGQEWLAGGLCTTTAGTVPDPDDPPSAEGPAAFHTSQESPSAEDPAACQPRHPAGR